LNDALFSIPTVDAEHPPQVLVLLHQHLNNFNAERGFEIVSRPIVLGYQAAGWLANVFLAGCPSWIYINRCTAHCQYCGPVGGRFEAPWAVAPHKLHSRRH